MAAGSATPLVSLQPLYKGTKNIYIFFLFIGTQTRVAQIYLTIHKLVKLNQFVN